MAAAAAATTNITTSSLLHKNRAFPHIINPSKPFHLCLSLKPYKPFPLRARLPARRRRLLAALDDPAASEQGETGQQEEEEEEEEQVVERREGARAKWSTTEEGKLFVGNLPYSTTTPELEELFLQAGRVVDAAVIYDKVTDRSRGFGFVTMETAEVAQSAIEMLNGAEFQGRRLKVNFPEVPKGGEREVMTPRIRSNYKSYVDSPHRIYAGNLSWRLTSQGLRDAFAGQRGLLSAKVIYERDSGRSRGFGFVSFETAEDAETALSAMDGVEVEGRPLRLNMAAERPGPPTPEGNSEDSAESGELLSDGDVSEMHVNSVSSPT